MKTIVIIATDKIGREEILKMRVNEVLATKLINAENQKEELQDLEDACAYGSKKLSTAQYRRLKNFTELIHHKFYNYEITIK